VALGAARHRAALNLIAIVAQPNARIDALAVQEGVGHLPDVAA
jgi:hypothetical protein